MRSAILAAVVVVALMVAGTLAVLFSARRGFSARDEPSAVEKVLARAVRSAGIPAAAKGAKNPVASSPDVLAEGRAHFADHCATCHANDGSGQTPIGQNLYPKAPDMRRPDTQDLADGELFYIIRNGVRLTGMPAWGGESAEADEDSWKLVHFIRHLPSLTPDEVEEMERMNPKTQSDLEEEKADREFLSGTAKEPPPHREDK